MGILQEITKRFIPEEKEETKPVGISGIPIFGNLPQTDYNSLFNEKRKHTIFEEMYKTDGTVQLLVNATTQPILSADWRIESEDEVLKEKLEAMLGLGESREYFKKTRYVPFQNLLRQALISIRHGYFLMEKIYSIDEDIIVSSFEARLPHTVKRWIVDKREYMNLMEKDPETFTERSLQYKDFYAVVQEGYDGDKWKEAIIPRERLLTVSLFPEGNNPEGESLLRKIYRSIYSKQKLETYETIKQERHSSPTPYVLVDENTQQDDINKYAQFLRNIKTTATSFFIGKSNVREVGFMSHNVQNTGNLEAIEHFKREAVQSWMANAFILGAGTNTGSHALAETQSDYFNFFIISIANQVQQAINEDVVQDFLFLNNIQSTASLEYAGIQKTDTEKIINQINLSVRSGSLSSDLSVENEIRRHTGLPEIEEGDRIVEEPEPIKDVDDEPVSSALQKEMKEHVCTKNCTHKTFSEVKRKKEIPAILGSIQKKVRKRTDWKGLYKKLQNLEEKSKSFYKNFTEEIREKIIKESEKILSGQDVKKIAEIDFSKSKWEKEFQRIANESLELGKRTVSESMNISAPSSSRELKNLVSVESEVFTDKIFQSQISTAKITLANSVMGDIPTSAIIASLADQLIKGANQIIGGGSMTMPFGFYTMGRTFVMEKNKDNILGYQFVNDLEHMERGVVCAFCEDLGGTIVGKYSDSIHVYSPPLHHGCMCEWDPITEDDLDSDKQREQEQREILSGIVDEYMPTEIEEFGVSGRLRMVGVSDYENFKN